MLQVPGTVLIQIRALDEDGVCKWTSYKSAFFVEDHINTPGHYEGDLTQLEQYEAEWGKVRDNVNQLNLRMDEVVRIREESPATEVEEEIVDARVGADNVVYGSLGSAIRKQFEKAYEAMENDTGDWAAAVAAEATARQNADTAEATARQTSDNTLQGNINSEASTRATQDDLLQSQIDQIIAPSGEAPSAAEVQNARIGADGVTYSTLGEAIRTNDTLLSDKVITLFNPYDIDLSQSEPIRVRTNYVILDKGDFINVSNVPTGIKFYFYNFTESTGTSWITRTSAQHVATSSGNYRVIFGKTDNSAISPNDVADVVIKFYRNSNEEFSLLRDFENGLNDELNKFNNQYLFDFTTVDGYINDSGDIVGYDFTGYRHYTTEEYLPINDTDKINIYIEGYESFSQWCEIGLYDTNKTFIQRVILKDDAFITTNKTCIVNWAKSNQNVAFVRFSYRVPLAGAKLVRITKISKFNQTVYKNKFVATSGTSADITNLESFPNYNCMICECTAGDRFIISGVGGGTGRLWNFISESGNILSKAEANENAFQKEIVAPFNTKYLVINVKETSDYDLSYKEITVPQKLLERCRISTPVMVGNDVLEKPTIAFSNSNIQQDQATVCTKFGILKNGNAFVITFAENVDHNNMDSPTTSGTGQMKYRYKYFHLTNDTESDVGYGDIASIGTSYIDINGVTQTMEGGCSFGSSVNGRIYFATAFTNTNQNNQKDYKPLTCAVSITDEGVTFGDIYELKLIVDGVTGIFNEERLDGWFLTYYTSSAPYYDSNGYKWLLPTRSGFAYLTSSDGITWTLVNICNTPYAVTREIPCVAFGNKLIFVARRGDVLDVREKHSVIVGIYDTTTNIITTQYCLDSNDAKPCLLKWGTSNALLCINRIPDFRCASFYLLAKSDDNLIDFTHYFDLFKNGTYYPSILQDTLNGSSVSELYMVGGNGTITNYASAFVKLEFDSSKPKNLSEIPFSIK